LRKTRWEKTQKERHDFCFLRCNGVAQLCVTIFSQTWFDELMMMMLA